MFYFSFPHRARDVIFWSKLGLRWYTQMIVRTTRFDDDLNLLKSENQNMASFQQLQKGCGLNDNRFLLDNCLLPCSAAYAIM